MFSIHKVLYESPAFQISHYVLLTIVCGLRAHSRFQMHICLLFSLMYNSVLQSTSQQQQKVCLLEGN